MNAKDGLIHRSPRGFWENLYFNNGNIRVKATVTKGNMRNTRLFLRLSLTLGLSVAALPNLAQAQPATNQPPVVEPPVSVIIKRPGYRGIFGGRPFRLPLSDNELRLVRAQRVEEKIATIKTLLTKADFTDEALQKAATDEYKTHDAADFDLLLQWKKLAQAVRDDKTPSPELATMLKNFREAAAKEKARHAEATTALETQFHVSQNPVLDALLVTMGVTGDEADTVSRFDGDATILREGL